MRGFVGELLAGQQRAIEEARKRALRKHNKKEEE
jgi:hypothetical protein